MSSKLEKQINSVEEEQILLEKLHNEEQYKTIISDLEAELKLARQKLALESDSDDQVVHSFAERLQEAEYERVALRKDIREYKQRESRILSDYSELEEENINLQKQVLQLQKEKVSFQSRSQLHNYTILNSLLSYQLGGFARIFADEVTS